MLIIWISYLIKDNMKTVTTALRNRRIKVFVCEELFEELSRVLQYPHLKRFDVDVKNAIKTVKELGTPFQIAKPIKRYIPEDNADDYIIALALQTNSGFVTSGDKHLLSQKDLLEKRFPKLKIITKTEFEKNVS